MNDLTTCPTWCDRSHDDYSHLARVRTGEALHWRAIRADWDPTIELAHVTKRNRWTGQPILSSNPGRLRLRLTPYWDGADLGGPDGDVLATTIARGRQLIARLENGADR